MKNIKKTFCEVLKSICKAIFWTCFWIELPLVLAYIVACVFFEDDYTYCNDVGFDKGDSMCQADENNKIVIVK